MNKQTTYFGMALLSMILIGILAFANDIEAPKSVAYKFLTALKQLDYTEAKKYSTQETGELIDMMSSLSGMMPDSIKEKSKAIKIIILNEKIDGKHAVVTYTGDGSNEEGEETIKLSNINNKWLVVMSKDDEVPEEPAEQKKTIPKKSK